MKNKLKKMNEKLKLALIEQEKAEKISEIFQKVQHDNVDLIEQNRIITGRMAEI